jgi:hypothetical protein
MLRCGGGVGVQAATTGHPEDIWLDHQTRGADGSISSQVYMTPTDHAKMVHIETRLQEKIAKLPSNKPYTFEYFCSENTIVPGGTKRLGLFALQTSEWANPAKLGSTDSNIWDVSSELFLRDKTKAVRDRYQELTAKVIAKLAPVAEVYETYRDGTIPVMFGFAQSMSSASPSPSPSPSCLSFICALMCRALSAVPCAAQVPAPPPVTCCS